MMNTMQRNDYQNFISETQVYWSNCYSNFLSEYEAEEIITNVSSFFNLLQDCLERKKQREVGDIS